MTILDPSKPPTVKGWCPGAYRPMPSGDGLVLRVRPYLGQISVDQARVLCDLAQRYGTGVLELTSRANLQIRGIAEADYDAVLAGLWGESLLDAEPGAEDRRNIIVTPDWETSDTTHALATTLTDALNLMPQMPAKFGLAIDTGRQPWVRGAPGDIRLERDAKGGLILVADGAQAGMPVRRDTALSQVEALMTWFLDTGGLGSGRMARHVRTVHLPDKWQQIPRRTDDADRTLAGACVFGAPFGQIETEALLSYLNTARAKALRMVPGRLLVATGMAQTTPDGFCAPDDPRLNVHACTGAPGCEQALGSTRALASSLAATLKPDETLHVSGCAKGCAHPRAADRTYVATRDGFDLVRGGAPWDAPCDRALSAQTILTQAP